MRKTHSSAQRARYNRNVRTENVQHLEWSAYVDSAQIADHISRSLFVPGRIWLRLLPFGS